MFRSDLTRFADRAEAGRLLAERVKALGPRDPVVYALPRGGVPVAAEVAAALGAPLDLVLVRKIGAPGQPELALGAVVDGDAPEVVLNADIVAATGASEAFIAAARLRELAEIERRRARYLTGLAPVDPRGRTAVVVDDGLATGASARAALRALRRRGAARLVLATPVAPPETLKAMRGEADDTVCAVEAEVFFGIGAFYRDFHQLTDEEVIASIAAYRERMGSNA
ncbi:phosphoribosyltransferase [Falsiroseomonas bella]|uniref:Phosphoribosyltransferase n=1 Tax=Falsiroseomonas bella TaxID=2184016 RepID=A0A317FBY9_9PROT|nr:phosphoribosyltransferase family protein [Falsiroseomonas bella]PWS35962.1 phosphoribosyltransferase [Falsiroseomonas bella]